MESYKQAFVEEVGQKYPLDEYTRKILKDYQQDILGLRDEDVAPIELEIASAKKAEYQKSAELQKEQQEQQYIQTTTTKPTQENDNLSSEKGVDYTWLRDLLKAEKWKQADQETRAVMLKAAGREQERWLDPESIKNFPCTDLRTIEQLWVKYGNGHFGFSVQKRIWESVGKDLEKFGDRVGWRRGGEWLYYQDLTFETHAPEGHLPRFDGRAVVLGRFGLNLVFFSRVEACKV